jgi:hypothetical protein
MTHRASASPKDRLLEEALVHLVLSRSRIDRLPAPPSLISKSPGQSRRISSCARTRGSPSQPDRQRHRPRSHRTLMFRTIWTSCHRSAARSAFSILPKRVTLELRADRSRGPMPRRDIDPSHGETRGNFRLLFEWCSVPVIAANEPLRSPAPPAHSIMRRLAAMRASMRTVSSSRKSAIARCSSSGGQARRIALSDSVDSS